MAYGYILEAEYADGYIHSEAELGDVSPYAEGKNIFNDILEKRPEADHGRTVRFSIIGDTKRYDIDWQILPDNARPIYSRDMQMERSVSTGETTIQVLRHQFGFQYNDETGENHKDIRVITD